jgi:hypothetical protein
MTTLIFVENVLGSGQAVKLTEDFEDYSVSRELRPGENTRLVLSPFKSLTVEEIPLTSAQMLNPTRDGLRITTFPPDVERRRDELEPAVRRSARAAIRKGGSGQAATSVKWNTAPS